MFEIHPAEVRNEWEHVVRELQRSINQCVLPFRSRVVRLLTIRIEKSTFIHLVTAIPPDLSQRDCKAHCGRLGIHSFGASIQMLSPFNS